MASQDPFGFGNINFDDMMRAMNEQMQAAQNGQQANFGTQQKIKKINKLIAQHYSTNLELI